MYEHPYLAYKVNEYEQERLRRAVDCRRFLAEHADQIVPRAAGPLRRLGQRVLRAIVGSRTTGAAAVDPDATAADPDPAAARRRVSVSREPAPAR